MDAKMRYQKSFLIFSQEDGGYGNGQAPSGYVRIETRDGKSKISATVQNLKDEQGRLVYKLYLLSFDWKGIYPAYAGIIPIKRGKGEIYKEFDAENVAGTGRTIYTFNTAVLLAEHPDSSSTNILCPLAAYKDKKIPWREKLKDIIYIKRNTEEHHSEGNKKAEKESPAHKGELHAHREQPALHKEQPVVREEKPAVQEEKPQVYREEVPAQEEKPQVNKEESPVYEEEPLVYREESPVQEEEPPVYRVEAPVQEEQPVAEEEKLAVHEEASERDEETDADEEQMYADNKEASEPADDEEPEESADNREPSEPVDDEEPEEFADVKGPVEPADEWEDAEPADDEKPAEHEEVRKNETTESSGGITSSTEEYSRLLDKSLNDELYGKGSMAFGGCPAAVGNAVCPYKTIGQNFKPCEGCIGGFAPKQTVDSEKVSENNFENFKMTLSRYFEVSDPFSSKRRDYKWWKVNSPVYLNNILYQHNIRTPLLFNPVVITANFKYRHLIIGIYTDKVRKKEYIVCGVPGVHGIDEKPFGNMCRWVQLEGSRPKYGAFGYWLVYIDPKTGKFLPLN